MGIELIYPTVTLFLSDLRIGLGETSGSDSEQSQRLKKFLHKFKLEDKNKIEEEEFNNLCDLKTTSEIVELIDNKRGIFPANHDGCHQPLQLDDTYCLVSNYSGIKDNNNQPDYSPKLIDNLGSHWGLDQFLALADSSSTLGETWLYQAQLVNATDRPTAIAQAIYQNIADHSPECKMDWEKDLKAQGTLQGGEIYELWVDRATITPKLSDQIAQTPHILIWLMPANLKPANAYQQTSQSYQDLLYLCRYRHKILAAAHSSNACSTQLKQDYSKIIGYLQQMHQGIMTDRQLQEILISRTDFTYRLDLLKSQSQTIQTNRDNYLNRLAEIRAKDRATANSEVFSHFVTDDRYTPKYQKQIAADYEQLAPSQDILQILSQTVQGHIQIRQTQVDRTTNITIASIATGIAASQVLSAVITTYPKKRTELPISQGFITDTWQYTPILLTDPTLYVSLTLSVFFGVLMFMLLRWFPHWCGKLFAPKRRY